ncbi:hypothetical protein Gocc_2372 [Gaiella occulta]|uniref:Prevent-host-death family protein n=1 Tax=Gaiella occulta TaxID=1002870 RepID=A0A7M2YWJ7_9ACTN|nr:hypothetical protein [Gaiella occulta]RDI73808.1 hypothetical protein Gocc_2372 [Gaiella occulta]
MTTRIGIRELRDTLTAASRRVESGERLEGTRGGIPVAVIAPYDEDPLERLIASGRAAPGRPFRPPTRLAQAHGPKTASEILLEGREDRFWRRRCR